MRMIGRPSILILSTLCCAPALLLAAPHARAQVSFEVPATAETDSPVTGKPYEADKTMHTRRVLADGTVSTHDYDIHEARDSQGRILIELDTTLQPRPDGPALSLTLFSVRDPAAGTTLLWNNLHHIATRTHILSAAMRELNAQASGKPQPIPAKPEILGQRVIDGHMTTGRLFEKTIPAGLMGNATATVNKREWWTDEALHLVVLNISSNPQRGEATTELRSLKLVEPDPTRFQPPDGYTIHDIAPPGAKTAAVLLTSPPYAPPLDLAHAPALSHTDAMLKLTSGDPADKAIGAAVLVNEAQATSDISLKADVASSLARYNTGLPEAQQLAEQALHSIETASTLESPDKVSPADFDRETTLCRYWDTLGYVYFRLEHYDLALQYLQSAWLLDPRGYYALRLGRLQEARGDNAAALPIYREALAADGSDNERRAIRRRITALSTGPNLQSDLQPLHLPQPTLADMQAPPTGTAFFDLIYSPSTTVPTPSPRILFVSGTESLKPLTSAIAKSLPLDFTLPDQGPETVARRIELTCDPSACHIQYLSPEQAAGLPHP